MSLHWVWPFCYELMYVFVMSCTTYTCTILLWADLSFTHICILSTFPRHVTRVWFEPMSFAISRPPRLPGRAAIRFVLATGTGMNRWRFTWGSLSKQISPYFMHTNFLNLIPLAASSLVELFWLLFFALLLRIIISIFSWALIAQLFTAYVKYALSCTAPSWHGLCGGFRSHKNHWAV